MKVNDMRFLKGDELRLYGIEETGLYDLINHTDVYLDDKLIQSQIDFDQLAELERTLLDRVFPRKIR